MDKRIYVWIIVLFIFNLGLGLELSPIELNITIHSEMNTTINLSISKINDSVLLLNYSKASWITGPEIIETNSSNITVGLALFIPSNISPGIYNESILIQELINQTNTTTNTTNTSIIDEDLFEIYMVTDLDMDNYSYFEDCNDNNSSINPGMIEQFFNGIDDDCNPDTLDNPEIRITLDKDSYKLGEEVKINISAPDNTIINISIARPYQGDIYQVDLEEALNGSGIITYDHTYWHGSYMITTIANYSIPNSSVILTNIKYFNVTNSLTVTISGDTSIKEGESTTLRANPSGGIGNYTYKWILHDNSTSTEREINLSFTSPGTYNEKVIVNDSYGNSAERKVEIGVKAIYELRVIVRDNSTDQLLDNAIVEIDDKKSNTTNGLATFTLAEGDYDLIVSKPGYSPFIDTDVSIDKDTTIEVYLNPIDKDAPILEISQPEEGERVTNNFTIRFSAIDTGKITCSIYIGDNSSQWLSKVKEYLMDSGEQLFTTTLDEGSYKLRIECMDTSGNIATRETTFIVTRDEFREINVNNLFNEIEDSLAELEGLDQDSRRAVELLGIKEKLRLAQKQLEFINRDINELYTETRYTEEERAKKRESILENMRRLMTETIISVRAIDAYRFVKYEKEEDLSILGEAYKESITTTASKQDISDRFIEYTSRVIPSSEVIVAELEYINGSKKRVTIIHREIKLNVSGRPKIYEYIPKEIASSDKNIGLISDLEIVNPDPLLAYSVEDNDSVQYTYYIDRPLSSEEAKKIILGVMSNKPLPRNTITGFSFIDVRIDWQKSIILSIIASIAVLALLYIILGIFGMVPFLSNNTTKKIRRLANEALDMLDEKEYDKAIMLYNEARMLYESSTLSTRAATYLLLYNLLRKINSYYMDSLIEEIEATKMLSLIHI